MEPPPPRGVTDDDDRCLEVVDFDAYLATQSLPPADVLAVREELEHDQRRSVSRPEELAKLFTERMTDPMAALVPLLTHYELGDSAALTMFAIDRERAAPLVFASMPRSDRNVQYHSFTLFLRLVEDEREPICWDAVVSDAARRTLRVDTPADAAETALWALGVSGASTDVPLLRRYLDSDEGVYWTTRLRNAAQGALARLGDEEAIEAIRSELDVPVAKRITFERAVTLSASLRKAGFSRQRSFVPFVCRHLASASASPDIDVLPPAPNEAAAGALARILDDAPLSRGRAEIEPWKKRCAVSFSD